MTAEQLIEEGRHLARPCVYLSDTGEGEAIAVWGGSGIVSAPEGPYKHWLSLNCRYLPNRSPQLNGCMSIYSNEDNKRGGLVVVRETSSVSSTQTGVPLFAHPAMSLPPLEGVSKYGSKAAKAWFAENGQRIKGKWGKLAFSENFCEIIETYEEAWRDQCPFYDGSAYAVLGGWQMPDEDWYNFWEAQLLVWTFPQYGPWLEVWKDGKSFKIIHYSEDYNPEDYLGSSRTASGPTMRCT
jgi:hypothetical protein